ncbi:MAG: hemolysin family protein [Desulfurella sp.]|uniref:hemolysin family protein n=1 Tax=Desulfurella sp. TaxID=1962857 RepID=UPI003D11C15B
MISILLISIIALTLLEAIFDGAEIGILSLNPEHIDSKSKISSIILNYTKNPQKLLSAALVGTNVALVISSYIGAYLSEKIFNNSFIAIIFLWPVAVIFGQILPKILYRNYPIFLTRKTILVVYIFNLIFYPIITLMFYLSNVLQKSFSDKSKQSTPTRDEIKMIVKSKYFKRNISDLEAQMINQIVAFKEKKAQEIMIPLKKVFMLEENQTISDLALANKDNDYTRIPIFRERVDNIVGIVNVYDLVDAKLDEPLKKYAQEPVYFPEHTLVENIFLKMKKDGLRMVVIVDEYGSCSGIITIEDCLEEIFGEIEDEYDIAEHKIINTKGGFLVDADIEIEKINEILPINIEKIPEYETLGGFLLYKFGYIPQKGEKIIHNNFVFEIKSRDNKNIKKVLIRNA